MHASIDDISVLPVSPLLARLRAAAPACNGACRCRPTPAAGMHCASARAPILRRCRSPSPVCLGAAMCGALRILFGKPAAAWQHGGGRAAATLRPGPAYVQQVSAVLQLLRDVPLSYSLSGLEMTDDAAWLQTCCRPRQPHRTVRVSSSVCCTAMVPGWRAHGPQLMDALVAFGLSWIELSRHHPLQERNDAIMLFAPTRRSPMCRPSCRRHGDWQHGCRCDGSASCSAVAWTTPTPLRSTSPARAAVAPAR